jgi:hypothetical protein
MFLLLQRAFLALCLILHFACTPPHCRKWEIQDIANKIPCFNGGRLILGPDSDYSHLELEIIRNRSGIRFYINLLFLYAPPLQEDPSKTRVEILFEGQEPWIIYPNLLAGGQKLMLQEDVAEILIQAMRDQSSFILKIGRNQIKVIPDNFSIAYEQLLALHN